MEIRNYDSWFDNVIHTEYIKYDYNERGVIRINFAFVKYILRICPNVDVLTEIRSFPANTRAATWLPKSPAMTYRYGLKTPVILAWKSSSYINGIMYLMYSLRFNGVHHLYTYIEHEFYRYVMYDNLNELYRILTRVYLRFYV